MMTENDLINITWENSNEVYFDLTEREKERYWTQFDSCARQDLLVEAIACLVILVEIAVIRAWKE